MAIVSAIERNVYASHMSIFLADMDEPDDNDYDWHDEAINLQRVCPGEAPYELQIAVARYDVVPVRLRVVSQRPEPDLTASHVVENDLLLPSGNLTLHGVDDVPVCEPTLRVTPSRYRVRITYLPRTDPLPESAPEEPGDHYDYLIDLWPTGERAATDTLVQGPRVWAG
jgi:hypothetical protein